MCAAAPRAVSQSPSPQSQVAFTSLGSWPSSSWTRCRSVWALPTNSWTSAAGNPGLCSILSSFRSKTGIPPQLLQSLVGERGIVGIPPLARPDLQPVAGADDEDLFVERRVLAKHRG